MARITFARGKRMEPGDLLAILASGTNPDGTAYTLPTSGGGASGTTTTGDAMANPTTATDNAAYGLLWDGTQWVRARGNAAGGLFVQGAIADGVADTGNGVKVAGLVNTAVPTARTAGQRQSLWVGANGQFILGAAPANAGDGAAGGGQGVDAGGTARLMGANTYLYNATNFDRTRSVAGDAQAATGIQAVAQMGWNGTTYDRIKTPMQVSTDVSTVYNALTALTVKRAFANVAASQTDSSIVAAVASKKLRVLAAVAVVGGTATNLTFNSKPAGAGTAISPLFANAANGGEVLPYSPQGWFESAAGEGLTVTTGAGSTTGILVVYVEV